MACVTLSVSLLLFMSPCTHRPQGRLGDDERDGRKRHRWNSEALFPWAAGAAFHRRSVSQLRWRHRSVTSPSTDLEMMLTWCLFRNRSGTHFYQLEIRTVISRFYVCFVSISNAWPVTLHSFVALSDSVAKESCMLNLLLSLPEPNLITFLFLLDHLKRYERHKHYSQSTITTKHPSGCIQTH